MSGVADAGSPWPVAPPLASPRLLLEPLRVDHADEMAALLDDAALHTFIGGQPADVTVLRAQYERQVAGRSPDGAQGWLNWVVRRRQDGLPIGTLQATVTRESEDLVAEVAWVVAVAYQRRGYAREGAEVIVRWLTDQGVKVVRAHIHPAHEASEAVARSVGMRPTGSEVDGETRWQMSLPCRNVRTGAGEST